ncbi:IS6 family transposase [Segetibacter aerophilus]|uniref:IS6 family transposase n=1 Tax=Segetibacter aerophilus TaxID=670293 RepID=A0A512BHX5_9BACT|nr:IS6 family transposase [Segetibacter aerophilus]GEO11562.1 IS6 family transposase [Segetibacter aerophilus]
MFKGYCFPKEIILQAVYFKLRFSLSYRDIEELLSIRGVTVDHATVQRWVYKFTPLIEEVFRKRKKSVISSWRMDETYIKVKGEWMFLYRAVDKVGDTVDFLLTKRRNKLAAHKFLLKAITNNGCPKVINIDKSGANREAIRTYNKRRLKRIRIRQCKYLNNRVEGDHRFIKWRTAGMLGFKSFESASRTLTGIEIVRMIKKEQVSFPMATYFKTFCSLA